ncbi:related to TGS1 TrimethylGuanosine Synthase [Cephalotrichum gorgonifer]|uniref:Trimethylguanosine synthase n=1 Tax=Cephalotrichum gorgonifer TaxID=2041049 RepID=A0AAE8MNW2_9PEZI|nr:related to TGS1 TrimethylGuanosine Synthase [Cephalotrichum gorgonifer]
MPSTTGNNLSNGDKQKYKFKPAQHLPLTEKCQHYTNRADVPLELQKYWAQRYTIFSSYDDGVAMTDDAWFGVTPEPVALQIAWEMNDISKEKTTIIDIFAGAGGNSIPFALSERWSRVISIEKDRDTLACAQNNASIYGVTDQITWVLGDSFKYLSLALTNPASLDPSLRIDPETTVIFASPPWGGPGYTTDEVFNLHEMEPYNLSQLHEACKAMDHALFLPRSSDLRQIAKLMPAGKKAEVVQYCVEGASKAMVAYIPAESSSKATFYYHTGDD